MNEPKFDLEDRLLDFTVRIVKLVEDLPASRVGNHVGGQLLRSGTSPFANHGEAQGAESARDFIHKMSVALKELRETERWLKLIRQVPLVEALGPVDALLEETDQLIRIFVSSINTAEKRK